MPSRPKEAISYTVHKTRRPKPAKICRTPVRGRLGFPLCSGSSPRQRAVPWCMLEVTADWAMNWSLVVHMRCSQSQAQAPHARSLELVLQREHQERALEESHERVQQSALGTEGLACVQCVQWCVVAHAPHTLARQRSVPDGLGCTRAKRTRPRQEAEATAKI